MEPNELSSQSTAGLVRTASEQIAGLVRAEIQLAKAEVTEKGRRAGMGAGMLAGAAVFAFYAFGVLLAAIVLLLALVLPAWAAALIVAGVGFAGAAGLVLGGRASLRRALPPVPRSTVASVRADIDTVRTAFAERGRHDGTGARGNGEVGGEKRRAMTGARG